MKCIRCRNDATIGYATCVACRLLKIASNKRYRIKNAERIKQNIRDNHDHFADIKQRSYNRNRDRNLEYSRNHYQLNREKLIEDAKQYNKAHAKEKKAYQKSYQRNNLDKYCIYAQKRNALKKKNGGDLSLSEWNEVKRKFNFTCLRCLKREPEIKLSIDHIIPISKGGKHSYENIQPLCKQCNCIKRDKTIDFRSVSTRT